MKNLLLISGAFLFVLMGCNSAQQQETEMPWFEGKFAEAQRTAGSDDLMIFFETEW